MRASVNRTALAITWALAAAISAAAARSLVLPTSIAELRLIGTARLAQGSEVGGTRVGGLSGLDCDAANDRWLAISDDRSEHAPARFYALRLDYDADRIRAFEVMEVTFLRQRDGSLYPDKNHAEQGGEVPDGEALRLDPRDGCLWYTSEGDAPHRTPPWVRQSDRRGHLVGECVLPPAFTFDPTGKTGVRPNLTLEGLAFTPDGEALWLGLEAPLLQDGSPPTSERGAWVRLTCVGRAGDIRRQVAYPLDPAHVAPAPGRPADNGLSEILAVTEDRLLVLERAGAQQADGSWRFGARLYEANLSLATDVARVPTLVGAAVQPAQKRLLVDFQRLLPDGVWNCEGLAWGRRLANGHLTLIVLSDDNFDPLQKTECHVFEVIPIRPKRNWDEVFDGVVHDEKRIAGFVGTYRWLSNFYPCRVEFEGLVYGSSEAAYQASKYPAEQRTEFVTLDADSAKKLSRKKGVDPAWWDARKERVMREIVRAKFTQNNDLADQLLATGERVLEETNWWGDRYWGVVDGEGGNMLGKILMDTRGQLRRARAEGK